MAGPSYSLPSHLQKELTILCLVRFWLGQRCTFASVRTEVDRDHVEMSLDCRPHHHHPWRRFALVPTSSQKVQLALYLTVMSGSPLSVPFSSDPSPVFLVLVRKSLFLLLTSLASGAHGFK